MKKILVSVLAVALLLTMMLSLVSCGNKPSGEYGNTVLGTFEFSGDEFTYTPLLGKSITGSYSVDDEGNLSLVVEGDDSSVNLPTGMKYDKENDKVTCILGDFTKAD